MGKTRSTKRKGTGEKGIQAYAAGILADLRTLSEKEVLNLILEHPTPRELVQGLPSGDFFWLMKKVGEDGARELLRLASTLQWQYVLDLELWRKDRLDLEETSSWLGRLLLADPERLVSWLFEEGQALAYFYLFRSIEVVIRDEDEAYDLDEGFVTLDGLFYIKVNDPARMETIEGILRTMADADFLKYQAVLTGLAGVLPAELEEDMYRMKAVRLAEHGFLPREEALQVYAPLAPEALSPGPEIQRPSGHLGEDILDLVPYAPLLSGEVPGLFGRALSKALSGTSQDRLRLEFAGLCNQILSADDLPIHDTEVIQRAWRKAAGYINLVLENRCGENLEAAMRLLEQNPLVFLFRAGFGLTLRLKWEAEGWLKESWFRRQGLGFDFWGEAWGYPLSALLAKRPLYYDRENRDGEYRIFEHDEELSEVRLILRRVMTMDSLLARLTADHPLDLTQAPFGQPTFQPLLFTFWARKILGLPLSFAGITLDEARTFFGFLRSGDQTPPYRLAAWEDVFVEDMAAAAGPSDPAAASLLKETLIHLWEEFCGEYEQVPLDALDRRFSPYLAISPSRESAPS